MTGYTNSYRPTYYSTLHDSIASLCKTLLPFSTKNRSLPFSDHKLLKLQSDNLKWQQDSFHRMINLMGLQREGIASETDVSAFRMYLLDTLIASPLQYEQPVILRDKLLFLQELLYAKCISVDEYHSSKRPLLQRMAVQGAEIEARDVIIGKSDELKPKENLEEQEEWSVIDLRDEKFQLKKDGKSKNSSSAFGFISTYRVGRIRKEKSIFETASVKESGTSSILMAEKGKRKPFRSLFQSDKKNKTKETEEEIAPLHINGRSGDDHGDWNSNQNQKYTVEEKEWKSNEKRREEEETVRPPWTTFEDDENCHPNLFDRHDYICRKNFETRKNEEQLLHIHGENPFWDYKN